ncbi:MAG: orotate phosphoribosyltransferase [Actinomycetota bacterium]|nr:orotate phosphoribosyltransferase [Actinomycetota bacterium]MDD5666027.1 orotate phosphoribosyltransferase [Actinomycetota bacterium]
MNQWEVLEILEREEAVRRGHFLLTSGLHSDTYVQCAMVLQHPHIAESLADEIAKAFQDEDMDLVISPALGGIIIGYMVAMALRKRMLFAERVEGGLILRRGQNISPGEKALIVEDVITTGGSVKELMKVVEAAGAKIIGVAALIERGKGRDLGVRKKVLLELEAEAWEEGECPLCKQGLELETPGSRGLA